MNQVSIHITKGSQSADFELRKGLGLMALQTKTDLIEYDCKKADCGICIIRVLQGADSLSEKTAAEQDFLKAMHADADERLACQCRAFGNVSIEVAEDPI